MYPRQKKVLATKQGEWLRKMCLTFIIFDYAFFVFALLVAGFKAMLIDLLIGLWGYSAYLTVREWVVILYLVFKCMAAWGCL